MTQAQEISIDNFDERAANEQGVEVELVTSTNQATGIHLRVLGEHSEKVSSHTFRTINTRRRQELANARKGKNADVRPIEDDVTLTIDKAVIATIGWRGPKEPFGEANLRKLLMRNPSFVTQILEASADSAAFTQG